MGETNNELQKILKKCRKKLKHLKIKKEEAGDNKQKLIYFGKKIRKKQNQIGLLEVTLEQ